MVFRRTRPPSRKSTDVRPGGAAVSLVAASPTVLPGLAEMLLGLGDGEAGVSGTRFGRGEQSLDAFLADCVRQQEPDQLPDDRVPQTTYWILADGTVLGMLRMRHWLNDALRVSGGHIGYYVAPRARRRGIASAALGLGLEALRERGESRALLTTSPDNVGSIRVIEGHGGVLTAEVADPAGGRLLQFWIELGPGGR